MLMGFHRSSDLPICLYALSWRTQHFINSFKRSLINSSTMMLYIARSVLEHIADLQRQANLRGYVATQVEDKRLRLGIVSRDHGTKRGQSTSLAHASCLASDVDSLQDRTLMRTAVSNTVRRIQQFLHKARIETIPIA